MKKLRRKCDRNLIGAFASAREGFRLSRCFGSCSIRCEVGLRLRSSRIRSCAGFARSLCAAPWRCAAFLGTADIFYRQALIGQVCFYAISLVLGLVPSHAGALRPLRLATMFTAINAVPAGWIFQMGWRRAGWGVASH